MTRKLLQANVPEEVWNVVKALSTRETLQSFIERAVRREGELVLDEELGLSWEEFVATRWPQSVPYTCDADEPAPLLPSIPIPEHMVENALAEIDGVLCECRANFVAETSGDKYT